MRRRCRLTNYCRPTGRRRKKSAPGRTATTIEYRDGGRTLVRMVRVDALGHAWSGGDAAFPYNDREPPDATALLGAFVAEEIR